jgi:hypothetical protein
MDAGLTDVKRSVRSTQFFVIFRLLENRGSFSGVEWMLGELTWEAASVPHNSSSFSSYWNKGAASQESNGCWVNQRGKKRPFHTIRRHFPPTGKQGPLLRSRMDAG